MLSQWFRMPYQRMYSVAAACFLFALFLGTRLLFVQNEEAEVRADVHRAAGLMSAALSGKSWSGEIDAVSRKVLNESVATDDDIHAIFVVRRTEQPTTLAYMVDSRVGGAVHPIGSTTDVQLLPGASEALGIGYSLDKVSMSLGLYPIFDVNEKIVGLVGVEHASATQTTLKSTVSAALLTLFTAIFLVSLHYVLRADDRSIFRSMLRLKSGKKIDADASALQLQRRVTQLAEGASRRSFIHREAFVGAPSPALQALHMAQSGFSGGDASVVLAIKIVGMYAYEPERTEKVSLDMSYSVLEVLSEVIGTHGGTLLNYWDGVVVVLFEHDAKGAQFRQLVNTLDRVRTRLSLALRELERTATNQRPRRFQAKYGVDVGRVLSTPRGGRHWSGPVATGLPIRGATDLLGLVVPDDVEVMMTERVVRRLRLKHAVVDVGQHEVAGSKVRVLGI